MPMRCLKDLGEFESGVTSAGGVFYITQKCLRYTVVLKVLQW